MNEFFSVYCRKLFIAQQINAVVENNLDGINIDYRSTYWKSGVRGSFDELTSLMRELRSRLQGLNRQYELSISWVYCPSCYGKFDFSLIKHHIDYLVVMTFDKVNWTTKKYGLCYVTSNDKFYAIKNWIDDWIKSGIPKKQLLFVFPWFGYEHKCHIFEAKLEACYTKCTDTKDHSFQVSFFQTLEVR